MNDKTAIARCEIHADDVLGTGILGAGCGEAPTDPLALAVQIIS